MDAARCLRDANAAGRLVPLLLALGAAAILSVIVVRDGVRGDAESRGLGADNEPAAACLRPSDEGLLCERASAPVEETRSAEAVWKIPALGIELPWPPNFRPDTEPRDATWPFELRGSFLDWPGSSPDDQRCVISLRGPYSSGDLSERHLLHPDERIADRGSIGAIRWIETVTSDRSVRRRYVLPLRSNAVVLTCEVPPSRGEVMRVVCDELAAGAAPLDARPAD